MVLLGAETFVQRTVVVRYRMHLESRKLAPGTVNLRAAARLRSQRLRSSQSGSCCRYPAREGRQETGDAIGKLVNRGTGRDAVANSAIDRRKGKRDRALLAVLLACGLRRYEAVELNLTHLQQREQHWAITDLIGKAGHMRTIPMPDWVKAILDVWIKDAPLTSGRVFRWVNRAGRVWGESMTEKVVWHVVREFAAKAGIEKVAPHDLRRTCARLCHIAVGELEQIQFLLGHVSIQTTERYPGCKQRIRSAVNDRIGIEPKS